MTTNLPDFVTVSRGPAGLPILEVRGAQASARLHLQGDHVVSWVPREESEVLFLSERSRYAPGEPIRGGIPICGPWFGQGRGGDRTPAHGFFRRATWEFVEAFDTGEAIAVDLVLPPDALAGVPGAQDWPADVQVGYRVTVGRELGTDLRVTAGAQPLEFEEALHTYFRIGDIRRVQVDGLAGASYLDKVAGRTAVQDGPVRFDGEADRVYTSTEPVDIVDRVLGRRITVTKAGSANTVVWNPAAEKAAATPDLGDDEWVSMVCVEAANCLDAAVRLEPGASHTMSARVSLQAL